MESKVGDYRLDFFTHLTVKRYRVIRNAGASRIRPNEYPAIPNGYSCYVCGSTFDTNQERLMHLEKFSHRDLYNTGSPQEKEEIHRLFMVSQEG
jgi:hypothetical protein